MTGIPSKVIASIVASGHAPPGAGVHTVDTAIDPDRFFAELAPFLRNAEGRPVDDPVELRWTEEHQQTPMAAA